MATFVSGYIRDLSPVKDNIKLRVRVVRTWLQPVYNKPHTKNMEMIVMNEHDTKLQATVKMEKINRFKHQLKEEFEPCPDFNGSYHGFVWRPYKSITHLAKEEDGQFDIVGQVIACGDVDKYDKNGKAGKKKPLTVLDDEGNEINCTLWGDFAHECNDFLNTCDDHDRIILVLQLAMMKFWDGKMCIQNGYWGTKLYLFNGKDSISEDEFKEVEDFRQRLFANQTNEQSENTATKISTPSKNSTKDHFLNKHPLRNIAELLYVEQVFLLLLLVRSLLYKKMKDGGTSDVGHVVPRL